MEERSPEFRKLLDVIDNRQFDLYKMWNDPANANIRKLIAQEYLDSFREYNKINGFQNNDVEDIKRVGKMLPGAEKYLPRSGVLGTVRDKLSDAARVAGQATAILRGGIAAGMSLPVLAAALVGLGIGKVVAENMAADALKAQNPATLRVRPGSANEPAYSLLQDTAMGLLPASVTNTLPGVPAGFDSRKAPPPEGLPIDTSGLLAPAAVPAAAAEPEPEPDVPPPPSDNQLSGYNVPAGLPGGNLATKILNVSYTAIPNAAEMMITINYEDGSSKPVRPNNPELRAYEDALPNRGPGISDSVSSALSGFGSAVAGALTPSTVVVGPDGKVRLPAPESPKNPLVAQALASPGVPPAMSDTDMYGAPAPGATDTQLAGAKSARDATGAAWNQPITPADRERVQANAEKQFVQLMESRWTEGLSTLNAMGLRAQSDALSLARNGMIGRRNSALANLNSLRPALLIATQALTRQAPTSAVDGSAEYQLWMQQQSPQVMSQFLAANEAHAKAQVAYDAATEAYIASTLAPELLANKPGEWSNIREAIDPSGSGQKVLMGLYTDGSGRQSFRIIGWDDSVGALTQAPAPDPADPNAGKRGGGEIAPTIIPGQGAALPGAAQAAGATPRPAVPPAAPGGAPGTGGTRPIVVSGSAAAAAAAPRPRAYESVNDRTTGFRSTYNDDGVLVGSTKIPGWDVRQTYTHTTRMRDDGSMVDLVMDTLGNVIEERVLTSPDPLKVQAAEQARQNAETQRVVQSNTNLGNQYTLARQAAIDTQGRNDTEYKDARTDLEGKIKASTEERKRKVLDLVAQKKLTLPQALSILHDQQGLATAMSAEQQRWEQQRGQRMAEKDKGLTYAQSLDKDLGIGGALLSLRSDPQAEDIKRRYAAEIPTLPGRPEDSVGVRLAQQRGYSGVAYQDPGAWQQPDLTMTPEALSGMGVGEDPTDAFYAQYQALQRRAPVAAPAPPVFQPLPTFGQPAAPVAQMPAAVGGWGAGLGRLGQ